MRWSRASQPAIGLRLHVLRPHPVITECSGSDGSWERTTLSSSAQIFSIPLILATNLTAREHRLPIPFVLFSYKILDIPPFHRFSQSTTAVMVVYA